MTFKASHLFWLVAALIAGAWPLALPTSLPTIGNPTTAVADRIGDAVGNVQTAVRTQVHNVVGAVKF